MRQHCVWFVIDAAGGPGGSNCDGISRGGWKGRGERSKEPQGGRRRGLSDKQWGFLFLSFTSFWIISVNGFMPLCPVLIFLWAMVELNVRNISPIFKQFSKHHPQVLVSMPNPSNVVPSKCKWPAFNVELVLTHQILWGWIYSWLNQHLGNDSLNIDSTYRSESYSWKFATLFVRALCDSLPMCPVLRLFFDKCWIEFAATHPDLQTFCRPSSASLCVNAKPFFV